MAAESGSVGQMRQANAPGVSHKPQKGNGKKAGYLIPFAAIMGSLKQAAFRDGQKARMGGLAGTAEARSRSAFAGCTTGGEAEISPAKRGNGLACTAANDAAEKLRFRSECGDGDKKARGQILKEWKNGEGAFFAVKAGSGGKVSDCDMNNVCKKTAQHGRLAFAEEPGLQVPAVQKAVSEKESSKAKISGARIQNEGTGEKMRTPGISSAAKPAGNGKAGNFLSSGGPEDGSIAVNPKSSERVSGVTKSGGWRTTQEDRPGVFPEKALSGIRLHAAENGGESVRPVWGDTFVVKDGESSKEAHHAFAKGSGGDSAGREPASGAAPFGRGGNRDVEPGDKAEFSDIETRKQASPADDGVRTSDFGRILSRPTDDRPAADETVKITPRAIIDQIADGAKASGGRVRITLNPPDLGTLDMDVMVRDSKVHVVLRVESSDVGQMLQSNAESLKSSLQNQGLAADSIHIFLREKSDEGGYGSGNGEAFLGRRGGREGNERDRKNEDSFSSHVFSLPEEEGRSLRDGGHISLLA